MRFRRFRKIVAHKNFQCKKHVDSYSLFKILLLLSSNMCCLIFVRNILRFTQIFFEYVKSSVGQLDWETLVYKILTF
jgi:hypothetical protein